MRSAVTATRTSVALTVWASTPNKNRVNCNDKSKISSSPKLTIYPNPVTEKATFEILNLKTKDATFTIYNSYGMVVYNENIGDKLKLNLAISDYITQAGVYFAVIKSNKISISKKFIFSN